MTVKKSNVGLALGAALAVVALTVGSAGAAPVHVQVDQGGATEYGAGFSVGNGTDCFIVTPYHVVETAQKDEITVTDSQGHQSKANVFKESPHDDMALLKANSPESIECPADWPDGTAAAAAVKGAQWLTTRKVDGNGGLKQSRWFVASSSPDMLKLEPYGDKDQLQKGDSGSSVFADNVLVGMVVRAGTGDGSADVVSQARIFGLFNADVAPGARLVALLQPITYRKQENPYATVAAREFIGGRTPMALQEIALDPRRGPMTALPAVDQVPEGVDFVVLGSLVEISSTREANRNYKPPKAGGGEGSLGTRLLKSMGSALTGKNEDAPYYVNYNIDVDVQVLDVKKNSSARNLERLGLRFPQRPTDDAGELQKSAVQQAVTQALDRTFRKYGLPLR